MDALPSLHGAVRQLYKYTVTGYHWNWRTLGYWTWFKAYIWGAVKNKTLRKKRWFQFSHCELSIVFSNIPAAPAYGVYISHIIRYSKACSFYQDVFDRGLLLRMKLLNQGFLLVRLKSSLRKCYGRHHAFADRYGLFLSQITTDMFHFSSTLLGHFLIHDLLPSL